MLERRRVRVRAARRRAREAEPGGADLRGADPRPTRCACSATPTRSRPTPRSGASTPGPGDIENGEVRGRGAQDMKGQVAAEVAASASLGREGWRPRRGDLLIVTTADEEMGAAKGAQWLCREHPDKVRCDLVLNEGGGASFELGGRRFYPLCVGEKGVFRFELRARGTAGHASVPGLGDNALLKLAPFIQRLREQPAPEPTPEGLAFLEAVTGKISTATRRALPSAWTSACAARPRPGRLPGRADARRDACADPSQGVREGERDPLAGGGPGRLPGAARDGRGGRARGARLGCSESPTTTSSSSWSTRPATARRRPPR